MPTTGPQGYRCPDCKQWVSPAKPTCKCDFQPIVIRRPK